MLWKTTGWLRRSATLRITAGPALALAAFLAAIPAAAGFGPALGAEEDLPAPPIPLEKILEHLGEKARVYESVALRFICIETARTGDKPNDEHRFDYMYVEAEAQRYRPYRQKHTGRPGRAAGETALEIGFPDSYSWTLMFSPDRQHLFNFKYVGQEWFSLRLALILEFTAPLPFNAGSTIYEWGGKVWVDAENYNFLKVEAEPGNQGERMKQELRSYRQSPRFLIFALGSKPLGARYDITFLNEYQMLSLPDTAEYRSFSLDLQGREELDALQTLRYSGYQFFNVDIKDKFLK
jgi:hypothetical protein